jgi:DNA-binding transcriptional ArsR family regulator
MAIFRSKLSESAYSEAAECLGVLAHKDRLKIIDLLLIESLSVGEIAERCQLPQNVTSEHLRLMLRCRFLSSSREGRFVFYKVVEPHLKEILGCIKRRFSGGKDARS